MKRSIYILILIFICSFQAHSQLLYEISGNGLEKPSYIFGTHHLAPISILDSIAGFKSTFESVDQIVGEIDMSDNLYAMAMKMQPYMVAPADSTLDKILTAEQYIAAENKIKEITGREIPLSLNMFNSLRPAAVSNILAQIIMKKKLPNFDINQQLDSHIQKSGKLNGKTIIGLETPEMQARLLFCFTPIEKQAEEFLDMLDKADKLEEQVNALNKAYFSQNLDLLEAVYLEDESDPEFLDALIKKRNQDWMRQIPSIIASAPTLIVVGALHLPLEDGLLRQLTNSGYKISAVK